MKVIFKILFAVVVVWSIIFLLSLYRQHSIKIADMAAHVERDRKYVPLRKLASIEIVKREILPRSQAATPPSLRDKSNINFTFPDVGNGSDPDVLVTTYRLKNIGYQTITSVHGEVDIWKADDFSHYGELPLASCSIEEDLPLSPNETRDIPCAWSHLFREASTDERTFVHMPESEYRVDWSPYEIKLADGSRISSGL